MIFITYLSLSSFPEEDTPDFKIPHADKIGHFAFYFFASILGCFVLREKTRGQFKPNNAMLTALISMIIYGIIIEVFQRVFTVERTADILDVLANSLGAFCGVAVVYLLFSGKTQLKWKN